MCDLNDARKFCQAYNRTCNAKELTQAWDLYLNVFKRISQQLKQITSLDLNYIRYLPLLLCQLAQSGVDASQRSTALCARHI